MKVELKNIHKWFGKVHANDGITLTIPSGTIQGILGENGAGKSTLMKILSGFIQADEGTIILDDQPVTIKTPSDAIHYGIGMLHQDPLDFPPLRVIDNFLLGHQGGLFPDRKSVKKTLLELEEQIGFKLDPEAYVDRLTVGERQQLEILRLLWLGAQVLILDEPTTGISASQRQSLFAALKILSEQGKAVIFVSHKLEEIAGICDRVAIFRAGQMTGEAEAPYNLDELVRMMFGKPVAVEGRVCAGCADEVLCVENLSIEDYRLKIRNVNLTVCAGEVIGLAGMEGSGQRHFLRSLAGLIRPVGGSVKVNQKEMFGKNYQHFLKAGVKYVPASRMEEGLISGLTLTEHFVLVDEEQGFFINRERAQKLTNDRIGDFLIRGTPASRVEMLSGGNQQRALLALLRSPLRLLLMEHPTRGLDIESSIWIWGKLKERCKQGTSIIFISSDLEELLQYSDRILVFFNGKVSQQLDAATTSVEDLGQLIGGKGL